MVLSHLLRGDGLQEDPWVWFLCVCGDDGGPCAGVNSDTLILVLGSATPLAATMKHVKISKHLCLYKLT